MEIKINSKKFGDKEILNDSLFSQKHMTECYNYFSNECSDQKLRDEFVNILCEEHQLEADIFLEMKKRGFVQPQSALPEDISAAKQKYSQEIKSI